MAKRVKQNFGPLGVWLFLTAAPLAATFFFSGQSATISGGLSLRLTKWILSLFLANPSAALLSAAHHFLRKAAHFSLFSVLGCGLCGLFLRQNRFPVIPVCILTGLLFASLDEFHQSFTAGRSPGLGDVLLDGCGVLTGSVLILWCALWLQQKQFHKDQRR